MLYNINAVVEQVHESIQTACQTTIDRQLTIMVSTCTFINRLEASHTAPVDIIMVSAFRKETCMQLHQLFPL